MNRGRTIVILLGAPGAGKGTQARAIATLLEIPHISTGQLLRLEIERQTELGRRARPTIEAGGLLDDDTVNDLVAKRIGRPDCRDGFVLDGYPRNEAQAASFQTRVREPDRLSAIDIVAPPEQIVGRLTNRLQCPSCGAVYNLKTSPPRVDEKCDRCGAGLIRRADDNEETIRTRIEAYLRETQPLVRFYRRLKVYHAVDGMRPAAQVTESIAAFLQGGS